MAIIKQTIKIDELAEMHKTLLDYWAKLHDRMMLLAKERQDFYNKKDVEIEGLKISDLIRANEQEEIRLHFLTKKLYECKNMLDVYIIGTFDVTGDELNDIVKEMIFKEY
jgi:hypothetical protein